MKRSHLFTLLVLILLPLSQAYGQQCVTALPEPCVSQDGACVAKISFGDSVLKFEATGTCDVNATACRVPRNKMDLTAQDLEAAQPGAENRLIETECQLYTSRRKCIEYEVTHTGCTAPFEITIFAETDNKNVSPRICQCTADLQSCQQGSPLPTAGVNGFWPRGTDPINRRVGGTSHFWWCNEVQDSLGVACFGAYELPGNTATVGSTFPIKLTLFDCLNRQIFIDDANVLLSIQLVDPCETFCPIQPLFPGSSEADNTPLYRRMEDHYQYNWVPSQAGWYEITSVFLNYNVPQQSILVQVVE